MKMQDNGMMPDEHAAYHENPQDVCPNCKSDDIENDGPCEDEMIHVNCHNCGYYWAEPCED